MSKKILSLSIIVVTLCSLLVLVLANNVNSKIEMSSYNLLANSDESLTRENNFTRTVSGEKWSNVPVNVYADSSFDATYISQLQQAISAWNSTRVGTVLRYSGTTRNPYMVSGIGVTKAPISTAGVVGNTVQTCTGSTINKAVITLNSNLSFNNGATTSGTYYLKSVFMHELGHSLGLDHNNDSSSIMCEYYTGMTTLSSSDIDDLDSLY